jgi:sterol desaturase/sphingolipid hydroxylase (fatty acid hydroxylase superfamily)
MAAVQPQPQTGKLLAPRQKEFTVWTLVAVAQDLFWFFGLPYLCRPWWEAFWTSLSPLTAEVLLNMLTIPLFLLYATAMLPVYYLEHPFFERFKISDKPWPWSTGQPQHVRDAFRAQTFRSVYLFAFNFCFLLPALSVVKALVVPGMVSFADADWPSYATMLNHNFMLTVIHELGFYLSHRAMHSTPGLYRWHKVHHEYHMNNVMAAQHNHPIDHILSIGGPALLALMLVRAHSFVNFQWTVYTVWANLDDHVGYSFPWSPVRWFPFANLTEQHEFHHAINTGSYASKLNIYDALFHTDETYLRWAAAKRDQKAA